MDEVFGMTSIKQFFLSVYTDVAKPQNSELAITFFAQWT